MNANVCLKKTLVGNHLSPGINLGCCWNWGVFHIFWSFKKFWILFLIFLLFELWWQGQRKEGTDSIIPRSPFFWEGLKKIQKGEKMGKCYRNKGEGNIWESTRNEIFFVIYFVTFSKKLSKRSKKLYRRFHKFYLKLILESREYFSWIVILKFSKISLNLS